MSVMLLLTALLGQAEASLERQHPLAGAAALPAVVSADERQILYLKTTHANERPQFIYCLANVDNGASKEVYSTPVDKAGVLADLLGQRPFADDGRLLVATTLSGSSLQGEQPDKLRAAVIEPDGRLRKIASELEQCTGYDFAGNQLVLLESDASSTPGRHRVRVSRQSQWSDAATGEGHASCLRVSPDGKFAAFLAHGASSGDPARLRCVDLTSGETLDTPTFRSADVTFDGAELFYWHADSRSVFAHVCLMEGAPLPFQLTRYDFLTGAGERSAPRDDLAMVALLDQDHAALWNAEASRSYVLSLADQRLAPLPAGVQPLGGCGRTIVALDRRQNEVFVATLTMASDK